MLTFSWKRAIFDGFWGLAGPPTGSKIVIFGENLANNGKKIDPGRVREKTLKNYEKMM